MKPVIDNNSVKYINGNGKRDAKHLIWIGGAIAICVAVSVFLFYTAISMAEARACAIEKDTDFKFQILHHELQEVRKDLRHISEILEKD